MKSFAPLPIWATVYHESEDNLAASAQAAAYRALFRQVVHTCEKTGVQNVAWAQPTFMAPFSFGTASHRNPAWWEPDWKGTRTGTAADWYTGAARVIDILSIDVYIPQISSTNWQLSTTLATVKKRWTVLGMPLAGRPWAVGELGVQADTITPDLSRGPAAMSRAYTTAGEWLCRDLLVDHRRRLVLPRIGAASDPGCHRELELAQLDADPRTAHP